MRNEIILIGPMLAGKSTVATIISSGLKIPVVSLDAIKWKYLSDYGITVDHADSILKEKGVVDYIEIFKPYEAIIVEKVLHEYRDCIFDFGAGFSICEDALLSNRVNELLADYRNIFLILPTDDRLKNTRIYANRLRQRLKNDVAMIQYYESLFELSMYFADHSAYNQIYNYVLYTHGISENKVLNFVKRKLT